ncbi:hypothetical protein [Priestia megaterium]|uniref:hypothetical protein n=1 Tax=Priestia megaterium TaxID=1404 RepID=UPI002E20478A|nr:hypothetical protein [Priestia megaterium]
MQKDRGLQNCSEEWRNSVPTAMLNQMSNLGYSKQDFTLCQAVALAKKNIERIDKADKEDELYMYYKRFLPERMAEIYAECQTFINTYEHSECLNKKRVAVIGSIFNGSTQADRVSDYLDSLPNTKAVRAFDELRVIVRQGKTDWTDRAFEIFVSVIDESDVVVLIPSDKLSTISWLLGYAWSQGKPVIVFTEDDLSAPLGMITLRSIQAHLASWKELTEYDFEELPYKRFADNLKGSEVKFVENIKGEQE